MKFSWLIAVMLLTGSPAVLPQNAATPAAPAAAAEQEFGAVRDAYQKGKQALGAAEEKAVASLQAWYVTNLEKLQADTTKLGNLDQVLAIKQEKERVTTREESTAQQIAAMPAPLRTLRTAYEGGLKKMRDDVAARHDALARKYLADLESLQTRITKSGDIDRALLVKAEKDRFVAERAANAPATTNPPPTVMPTATPRPPASPAPATPFGITQGPKVAKVEAQDTILMPLSVGEQVLKDGKKVQWTVIPKAFEGYQFTSGNAQPYLRFKVLTDGLVYMACTNRFFGAPGTDMLTDEMLRKKGWHKERAELTSNDLGWWIYSRNCKAGEEITLRTEKYREPVLLVK